MKRYFEKFFGPNAREQMKQYWRRFFNHSKHLKMTEGSQEINKLMTCSHKDQWRRNDK